MSPILKRPVFFEPLESRALLSAAVTDPLTAFAPSVSASLDAAASDVSVEVDVVTLPSSVNTGDSASGNVNVFVTNVGTATTPGDATIDLSIRARRIGAPDDSGDIVLGVFNALNIGNLPGGGTGVTFFSLGITLPADLPAGSYHLAAVGTPSLAVGDENADNNTGISSYSLAVVAVNDVGVAVTATTFSSSVRSGSTPSGSVTVTISNAGQTITPSGSTIDLSLYLRLTSASNGDDDIVLGTISGTSIGLLNPGSSSTATFNVTLPVVADGEYSFVVVGTPSGDIGDTNAANDEANSDFTVNVEQISDVSVAVAGVSLPVEIIAGQTPSGTVSVAVSNAGQVVTPAGSTIDFSLRARRTDAFDGSADIFIGSFNAHSISGLNPEESTVIVLNVTLPSLIEAGAYHIVVVGTPSVETGDGITSNDTATSAYTLTVIGTKDISLDVSGVTLPTDVRTGQTPSGAVTVTVVNGEDAPTPAGATIDLSIRARLTTSTDDSGDIVLATYKNEPIAGLGHGASVTFVRNATLPADLPGGTYRIVVVGSLSGTLADTSELNDTATSVFTFVVSGPDLTVALGAITVPTSVLEGQHAAGKVTATMSNSGAVAVPQNRVVDLQISLAPIEGGDDIVLTTVHGLRAGGLAAGAFKTYTIGVSLKKTVPANTYRIIGVIDPTNHVAEANESNNIGVSADPYTIAAPYSDLTARVVAGILPAVVPAGKARSILVTISVVNSGNVVIFNKTTIDMRIVLHDVSSGADMVLLTLTGVSVNQLGAGRAIDKKKTVTLPALGAGSYNIVGIVDLNNTIAEVNEGNNTASTVNFTVG